MSALAGRSVNIVGAGLAGALLAQLLARRGIRVALFERRADPRQSRPESGRSINLALAARGIRALEAAGLMEAVRPLLIPMRGRMVHEPGSLATLQPYGQRADEVVWSVGRAALNRVLIDAAAARPGVTIAFNQQCLGASPAADSLRLRDAGSGVERELPLAPTIATDGAGSALRTSLAADGALAVREEWLDHDYKELTIPALGGAHALVPEALHVWPRGGFMLIALPNTDGSFTATLFLPASGAVSFAALSTASAVEAFFAREFPDARALMPELAREFREHPQGSCAPCTWTPGTSAARCCCGGRGAGIVPFHGQGMNAAFEDCLALDALLDTDDSWDAVFGAFEVARRPNAQAIAQMAQENYLEMRDAVRDPGFLRRRSIAMALERSFPGQLYRVTRW